MPTNKKFDSPTDLLKYALETLVSAGLTIEEVDTIRKINKRNSAGRFYEKEQQGQRRYAVSSLLAANLSNGQIAEVLRVSKETVNADRQIIKKIYLESIAKTADEWKAKLLKDQDDLKNKAYESFEKSKSRRSRKVVRKTGSEEETETIEEVNTAGESGFLVVAKGCLENQAKLLGLYDPKRRTESTEKTYQKFLDDLSKEVKKIKTLEDNNDVRRTAVDVDVTKDEDRAIVPMEE